MSLTPNASTGAGASPAASAPSSKEPSRASTPSNVAVAVTAEDKSKLATFLGILRRFMGVADIASVRFSLPAQLLEPIPNLEYWNYLDRPETFISIGDSEEPLGRMLGCLRFWFTKDLKYVKGKPCKPYNSTLGEFFRCNWEIEDTLPQMKHSNAAPQSSSASTASTGQKVKVSFLTEQTSHHPPVSAFYVDCPAKGISARGFDQISAKFSGTTIKVAPGVHNLGIFLELQNRGETYQLTHPAAYLGGLLRGSLSVSVADQCYITCPKTSIKVILHYVEDGWLSRAQNKVEGVIFTYDPENDNKTKIKDVPSSDVLGRIEGSWIDKVYYTLGPQPFAKSSEKILLIDLNPLFPIPKQYPPEDQQLRNESLRFWKEVTDAITNKNFSQATALKHDLEERQREKAKEREAKGAEWKPRFFTGAVTPVGKPDLTKEGEQVLQGLHKGEFQISEPTEYGAM